MSKVKPIKDIIISDNYEKSGVSDIEEYNKDIEIAMTEIDNGQYIAHEEAIKTLLK